MSSKIIQFPTDMITPTPRKPRRVKPVAVAQPRPTLPTWALWVLWVIASLIIINMM